MPLRPDRNLSELHQSVVDNITTFSRFVGQLAMQSKDIRNALDETPKTVTNGRNFMQITMDDLLDAFEDTIATVKKTVPDFAEDKIPVEIYRGILHARRGVAVSKDAAMTQLMKNVDGKLAQANWEPTVVPQFLALIRQKAPAPIVGQLTQNWTILLMNMGQLFLSEQAFVAQNSARSRLIELSETLEEWSEQADALSQGDGPATRKGTGDARLEQLLSLFGEDLTRKASKLPETIGRQKEIEQTLAAVVRTSTAFALNYGEHGAGKSAVTEGVAQKIVSGDVPDKLKGARLIRLNLREMKAQLGHSQKESVLGDPMSYDMFTDNLNYLLQSVGEYNAKGGPQIILDIDELGELANDIPTMFQAKDVIASAMENYPSLRIIGEISSDKRYKLSTSMPDFLGTFQETEIKSLPPEHTRAVLAREAESLSASENIEIGDALLDRIVKLAGRYMPSVAQPSSALEILRAAVAHAIVTSQPSVTLDNVADVVSAKTKTPREFIMTETSDRIGNLHNTLPKRVIGQPDVLKIAESLQRANEGFNDPKKPLGSFLLVGQTGTGKTETGKALAEDLGIPFIRIDMATLSEKHTVSKLIGSPPGYVGYDDKPAFAQVADNPYCVLMLDEIEKAHAEIFNILLAVLEEGEAQLMNNGKIVKFNQCIILMSSNLGAKEADHARKRGSAGFDSDDSHDMVATEKIMEAVESRMPPEFINRLDGILQYGKLDIEVARKIALNKIEKVSQKLTEKNPNLKLELTPDAMEKLLKVGYSELFGARPLQRAIDTHVSNPVVSWFRENGKGITVPTTIRVNDIGANFSYDILPRGNDNTPERPAIRPAAPVGPAP